METTSIIKCGYCDHFAKSEKSGRSDKTIYFKCPGRKRKIRYDRKACKYFIPKKYFFCDARGELLQIPVCINRRLNFNGFAVNTTTCRNCRQFDREIREIVQQYFIDGIKVKKIPEPKPARKIKRRKKRIIKRRTKKQPTTKRKLRRRKQK